MGTLCGFQSSRGAARTMHCGAAIVLLGLMTIFASQSFSQLLSVHPSHRYLVTQDGTPFFLVGDAGWSLIAELHDADADYYFQSRHAMGFNTVIVNLLEHLFSDNAPNNIYNQPPFTGTLFTTPNNAYFQHVDYILNSAASQGIVVLLDPLYLGYGCGNEGWCAELDNADAAAMTTWGQYIGQRYASFDNIVWLIGGDTNPGTNEKLRLHALINGIKQYVTRHLFTTHVDNSTPPLVAWSVADTSWLKINNTYISGGVSQIYTAAVTEYKRTPVLPFFLIESSYENEHSMTQQGLRAESYWTVLSGGMGHVFGNCPIWHFDGAPGWCNPSGWKGQLSGQGSWNMKYFHDLFTSRRWYNLVPDLNHKVITAGYSSNLNYVTAAYCSDSSSIIAYLPSSGTVTVNMSYVGGDSAAVWWFSHSTGVCTRAGDYDHESRSLSPPSGSGDWVLGGDNENLYPDTINPISDVKETSVIASPQDGAYPNPFKTTVTILSRQASSVEVFDILGRRVFSEKLSPGQKTVNWTPRKLGYGMYFVRLAGSKPFKVLYVP